MQSVWHTISNNQSTSLLVLTIISLVSFLPSLGVFDPSLMEARNFVTAREMIQDGNWLLPTMNGEPRIAKPPLPTWMTALVMLIIGNSENVFALRLPGVFAGLVLVISMFGLVKAQTKNISLAFITGAIAATSLLILQMSRTGSWDIHCHSWMLAGIASWVFAVNSQKIKFNWLMLSAIFMGLSFMSKGPVSFYALLLPFLIASVATKNIGIKKLSIIQGLAFICVLLLVSAWWPTYVFFNKTEMGMAVVKTEATSWANRHVRPFYFYFHFPVYIGVWAIPFIASLFWKNIKSKFKNSDYTYLLVWIFSALFLLSVIPEKKERYMLPLIIPMAIMVGRIIYYGIKSAEQNSLTRTDRNVYLVHSIAVIIFNLAALGFIYRFGLKELEMPNTVFIAFCTIVLFLNYYIFKSRLRVRNLFVLTVVSQVLIAAIVLPVTPNFAYPNKSFMSLKTINSNKEINSLDWYSIGELNLKHVYALGRTVKTIHIQESNSFPKKLPIAIVSNGPLRNYLTNERMESIKITEVEKVNASRKKENDVLHITIINSQ
ncbi:MAG: phospholipid carrier-dependent glycosyltransferase [Bacteroidia bacterium]|nr:phospholipid carrier-dependent glycosyltransferase [Bacteroidia bacterium]